ncbi:MAG: hypothetical protein ACRDU5_11645 [Mycobacterium sp.]
MDAWLDSTVQRIGDWLVEAARWVGSIPDGVIGAVIGVIAMQIVTSVSTYRRRRDEYRAPQRAAIAALLAAANGLRVSITETRNDLVSRLIGVDQALELAFLTVVDGPCYDQLVAAEKPYETLKKIADNPLQSSTDKDSESEGFRQKVSTASNDLDAELGYLVELAQKRLRTSRRRLSKKPTVTRTPRGTPSIENADEDDVEKVDDVSPPPPDSEAAQEESAKSRPEYGQKRVLATSIKRGDRVFWTKEGVDLMLVVGTVTPATEDGMPCLSFSGMTYALSPGADEEAVSGAERGQADWTIPESHMVWKSVPWADADHGKP